MLDQSDMCGNISKLLQLHRNLAQLYEIVQSVSITLSQPEMDNSGAVEKQVVTLEQFSAFPRLRYLAVRLKMTDMLFRSHEAYEVHLSPAVLGILKFDQLWYMILTGLLISDIVVFSLYAGITFKCIWRLRLHCWTNCSYILKICIHQLDMHAIRRSAMQPLLLALLSYSAALPSLVASRKQNNTQLAFAL